VTSREQVLEALRGADDYISGEDLARLLGVSRAAVWKHIEALKREGHTIDGKRARGYRLLEEADALDRECLLAALSGRFGKRGLEVYRTTSSTNSDAMALGRQGAAEGTVVIADEQTAGRGRLGRAWESRPGRNLYLSVILRPAILPAEAPQLALMAGVAVAAAFEQFGCPCGIKWPNDVVTVEAGEGRALRLRKLAGILAEIEAEADRVAFVVLGIGVNLNTRIDEFAPELRDRAASGLSVTGRRFDRVAFTAALLVELESRYDDYCRGGFAALADHWRDRTILAGRTVRVSGAGPVLEGRCIDIDDDGALVIDDGEGVRHRVLAGDVTLEGGYEG
jgi:BirA family biotin operon repressor/biotin-[acetyl-CoA-carboxylase] ligase